ncbi:MAG: hypothetical protein GQ570_10550 [Helicobacteraceae bacterium]|nr:hypothetical protein [Helicobacteraceae bacterium]
MKIIRRFVITNSYKPIDTSIIKLGDTIDFDCYIQRFKDLVVIIYAGTTITQKELNALERTSNHFIASFEYDAYNKIIEKRSSEDQVVVKEYITCDEFSKLTNSSLEATDSQIEHFYQSSLQVVKIFFTNNQELPKINCIFSLIKYL